MRNLISAGVVLAIFVCSIWLAKEFLANEDENLDVPVYEWEIK